jgi:prevent-host-death family protein
MKEVNITELRQKLPEYLAKVRRGERLRITSRGKAIAEIVPPVPPERDAEELRARLGRSVLRYDRPLDPA